MVGGSIDADTFDEVIGAVFERAATSGRPVRAYGEMVAVLWADGDVPGAMELERRWNELRARLPFTLLCAYPARLFEDAPSAEWFTDVCDLHSEVVAGAPDVADVDLLHRFPRTPHAPRLARQLVRRALEHWSVPDDAIADALLVVSELVTNAMLHGDSDVAVGLRRGPDRVRVVVSDGSARTPAERALESDSLSGRGLAMVRSIASDWGHDTVDGGKLVWADVRVGRRGAGG